MRTSPGAKLLTCCLLGATLLTLSDLPLFGQLDTNDLGGLELPLVESQPQLGSTFWLLSSHYIDTNGYIRFAHAPTPVIPLADQGLPIYYLTPDPNFGVLST